MIDPILYEQSGRVVTITLNRAETRNALSADLVTGLTEGMKKADADGSVSCVILTGAGKSFCSGGNLKEIKALTAEQHMSPIELEEWYRTGIQRIPLMMAELSVPVIAAVNGHAIGAGCDLTTMCDIRLASEHAIFAESFLRVGLVPGDGGAWLLPRIIGMARASQMLFTGEFVDAEKALNYGLVSEVLDADALLDRAREMAEQVASFPPHALRKSKQIIRSAQNMTLKENLDVAAVYQGILQQQEDHHEAIDAILEKRKPVFKGR